MIVTWTKMIFNEATLKIITLGVLIFGIGVGLFSALGLLIFGSKTHGGNISVYKVFKLAAAILFGIFNMFHCIIFIVKHAGGSEDCADKSVGITYNVLSIIYTFVLMCILGCVNVLEQKQHLRFFSVGIFFANFSFWLDTLFSETGNLFTYGDKNDTSDTYNCT